MGDEAIDRLMNKIDNMRAEITKSAMSQAKTNVEIGMKLSNIESEVGRLQEAYVKQKEEIDAHSRQLIQLTIAIKTTLAVIATVLTISQGLGFVDRLRAIIVGG